MRSLVRVFLAVLLLTTVPLLRAQTAADPSGHWEGGVQAPSGDIKVEIDVAKNDKGALVGTFSNLADGLKGLPLATVAAEGKTVTLELRAGSGGGTFRGELSPDGKSLSGNFILAEGGQSIPFSLTRAGDAKMPSAPKSAAIGKQFEGTWNGALTVGDKQMRLILKMANQPDGTAAGTIFSMDGSRIEIPIAMTQKASNMTVEVASVGGKYVAILNAEGTELAGTWTQGKIVLPLTMRRETK